MSQINSERQGVIELVDNSGRVLQRFFLDGSLVTIGRAYGNDIIIDDPYMSPYHLQIEIVGNDVNVTDLNSENGLFFEKDSNRQSSIQVSSGGSIRIGHSRLRFRGKDFIVPAARVDSVANSSLALFNRASIKSTLVLLCFIVLTISSYFESIKPLDFWALLDDVWVPMMGIFAWAGLWSFCNRLIAHKFNYWVHCAIFSTSIAGFLIITLLTEYLVYALSLDDVITMLNAVVLSCLITLTIYAHLRYASFLSIPKAFFSSITLGVLSICLSMVGEIVQQQQFHSSPNFQASLKPAGIPHQPGITIEKFLEKASQLETKLEERDQKLEQ